MNYEHMLVFQKSLPASVPDEKVYAILEMGRELLRRMSGGARDIQFRHKVEELEDRLGGPLGQMVQVIHIQIFARFNAPLFTLPDETQRVLKQYQMLQQSRDLAELAMKAAREAQAEMERKVLEAKANMIDPVRDLPDQVITVPAANVPLSKMLVSDAELATISQHPIGVVVSDSPAKE